MYPILYSFRRCPYAIRARMALQYAGVQVELREIVFKDKPDSMLQASTKGTVPTLVFDSGRVIDESDELMLWALAQRDDDGWWREQELARSLELLHLNDHEFKTHLDHYKYADRYPEYSEQTYRQRAELFLQRMEQELESSQFLCGDQIRFIDVAIFPFIRQFAYVDKQWFDQAPYPNLQQWLDSMLESALFKSVMQKHPVWQQGDAPTIFRKPETKQLPVYCEPGQ